MRIKWWLLSFISVIVRSHFAHFQALKMCIECQFSLFTLVIDETTKFNTVIFQTKSKRN